MLPKCWFRHTSSCLLIRFLFARKTLIIIFSLTGIFCIGTYFFAPSRSGSNPNAKKPKTISSLQLAQSQATSPIYSILKGVDKNIGGNVKSSIKHGRIPSDEELAVVNKWLKSEGGFDVQSEQDYRKMYSKDQLRKLADNGDTVAAAALIGSYFHNLQSQKVPEVAHKCIAYGSLMCIDDMAIYYTPPLINDHEPLKKCALKS